MQGLVVRINADGSTRQAQRFVRAGVLGERGADLPGAVRLMNPTVADAAARSSGSTLTRPGWDWGCCSVVVLQSPLTEFGDPASYRRSLCCRGYAAQPFSNDGRPFNAAGVFLRRSAGGVA